MAIPKESLQTSNTIVLPKPQSPHLTVIESPLNSESRATLHRGERQRLIVLNFLELLMF